MQLSDVEEVCCIESESYRHPWTEFIFKRVVQGEFYCLVIVDGKQLCGYSISLILDSECHLLNLCIGSRFRRQGLANQLFDFLFQHLQNREAKLINLEVRSSNVAAIELYKGLGFNKVGIRENYYPSEIGTNSREDAILLTLTL